MTNKWDEVDKRIRSRSTPNNNDRPNQTLEPEILPAISPKGSPPEPKTIIARFRTNQIQRRLAIAQLSEYHDAKMELVKHQFKEAVRTKKAEASEFADHFLMELNHSHLKFLAELGLKNVDKRQEILIELNERTSRRMRISWQETALGEPLLCDFEF
jgi:hypothetical protein